MSGIDGWEGWTDGWNGMNKWMKLQDGIGRMDGWMEKRQIQGTWKLSQNRMILRQLSQQVGQMGIDEWMNEYSIPTLYKNKVTWSLL